MREMTTCMREALAEAEKAFGKGEVPIGAVIVKDGEIIARAHNLRETLHDPTAHAEILAIRMAGDRLVGWRLSGSTLYVTVEPCPMCAGALVQARIDRLIYGAEDPKGWAGKTVAEIADNPGLNHRVEIIGGILEDECREMMRRFFRERRS